MVKNFARHYQTILKVGSIGSMCVFAAGCGQQDTAAQTKAQVKPAKHQTEAAAPTDRLGEIVGLVGDVDQTWHTIRISDPSGTHSTANFSTRVGIMTDFGLQGHVDGELQVKDSLSVQFTLMDDRLVESGVKYFPNASTFPFYGDHDGSVKVTLESINITGDVAAVKGTVTGKIYKTVDFRTAPDTSEALSVSLSFDTKAFKE